MVRFCSYACGSYFLTFRGSFLNSDFTADNSREMMLSYLARDTGISEASDRTVNIPCSVFDPLDDMSTFLNPSFSNTFLASSISINSQMLTGGWNSIFKLHLVRSSISWNFMVIFVGEKLPVGVVNRNPPSSS